MSISKSVRLTLIRKHDNLLTELIIISGGMKRLKPGSNLIVLRL